MRWGNKWFLVGVALLAVTPVRAAAADRAPARPQYEIAVRVDTAAKRLTAREQVTFTNTGDAPLNQLYFHIYPNRRYTPKERDFILRFAGYFKVNPFPGGFPARDFQITSLTSQGRALTFAIEGEDETLLRVNLPAPLAPGQAVMVEIGFDAGVPQEAFGRFGWHENVMQLSRWYPVLAVLRDGDWVKNPFYPFHRPFFTEASDYTVDVTVPTQEVVAHTGTRVGEPAVKDGYQTFRVQSSLPVREFSLAMSPDYQVEAKTVDGVTIKTFYLPGDQARAQEAVENATGLMAYYGGRFGKYPYPEFSIAPVYLGYGGEQMSNMIFINVYAYRLPGFLRRYFDFLIAHETGHQWFFNMIGVNEYTQMWLEEGVNSYFIEQYLEHKYGPGAEVLEWPAWLKGWRWAFPNLTFHQTRTFRYMIGQRTGYDHAVVDSLESFSEPSSIFAVTYGKGARVLGMLEAWMGEETFNKVFTRVTRDYRFRNLDVADFIRICEEESGQDLSGFFEPWLFHAGALDYAVTKIDGNRVTLENRGVISVPAEVEVEFTSGGTARLTWNGAKEREEITVEGPGTIRRVTIDPDQNLLDVDRVNNVAPRQVHVKAVPLYWGLYDIPLFLPDDGYNVVAGPEWANGGPGLKVSAQRPYDQMAYAGTDYEFGESIHHSRLGYEMKNLFHSPTAVGAEISNRTDHDGGEEDLVSGKLYLRRELWPAQYGLTDINDHVTLYLVRNQTPAGRTDLLTGSEDGRNTSYGRHNESLVGTAFHLNRSGPYPDPHQGYQVSAMAENAGHFLEATQTFTRASLDVSAYQPVTPLSTLAARVKYGWGYPDDKNLYQLGGSDGLRGFDRKSVRGAQGLLGSLEYRFPILRACEWAMLDHILTVESVGGVVFFDAGQAWFNDASAAKCRKDAGGGLRVTLRVGSFLEKAILRLDVAQPLDAPKQDPQFWFGLGQAF